MTRDLDGVNAELRARVELMLARAKGALVVSSGFRSSAAQQRLWDLHAKNPAKYAPANRPGTSKHERGLAVDVECKPDANPRRAALAKECGLCTPFSHEPWHMELAPNRKPLPRPTKAEASRMTERKAVEILPTQAGNGYYVVAEDGGVYSYGDAPFHGSAADLKLQRPIVNAALAADGKGYYLVASDGGVFAFGSAKFHGSAVEHLRA